MVHECQAHLRPITGVTLAYDNGTVTVIKKYDVECIWCHKRFHVTETVEIEEIEEIESGEDCDE